MITSIEPAISVDPEVMDGVPVFTGTRVPVAALLENLEVGVSLDEFLENFPTVTLEQINAVLEENEFYYDLAIANIVMRDDREILRRLARS
jgi:uncharacterized protein (DUF433 family)